MTLRVAGSHLIFGKQTRKKAQSVGIDAINGKFIIWKCTGMKDYIWSRPDYIPKEALPKLVNAIGAPPKYTYY